MCRAMKTWTVHHLILAVAGGLVVVVGAGLVVVVGVGVVWVVETPA